MKTALTLFPAQLKGPIICLRQFYKHSYSQINLEVNLQAANTGVNLFQL